MDELDRILAAPLHQDDSLPHQFELHSEAIDAPSSIDHNVVTSALLDRLNQSVAALNFDDQRLAPKFDGVDSDDDAGGPLESDSEHDADEVQHAPVSRSLKAAIFDLDGTLLDTEPLSTDAINLTLFEIDPSIEPVDWELKQQLIGLKDHEWAAKVINGRNLSGKVTVSQIVDGWHHHLNQLLASAKALPGAYDLIHSLHSRGIPIALATSSLRQAVAIKRQCHEAMFACFSAIVCGDDVRAGKPAPDIFLRAAELLFVDPKHCVVFEDSPSGVTAGVRAEMHTVAVPDSRMLHSPAFSHATNVLPSLKHFKVDEWF